MAVVIGERLASAPRVPNHSRHNAVLLGGDATDPGGTQSRGVAGIVDTVTLGVDEAAVLSAVVLVLRAGQPHDGRAELIDYFVHVAGRLDGFPRPTHPDAAIFASVGGWLA